MFTHLVCSDIDGTLLNKDRQLSPKTVAVVQGIQPVPFILISSRMPKAIFHLQEILGITNLPMIAYNGGLIIHQNEVVHSTEIDLEVAKQMQQFCKKTSIHTSLYHHNEWYVPAMDNWATRESSNTRVSPQLQPVETTIRKWSAEKKGAHKIMCMGEAGEIEQLALYLEQELQSEVIGYRSKSTYLEISPRKISKKTAIDTLLNIKYPQISLENVIAFGDNYNDMDMLKAVGVGVAVENANEEVLAMANHKTLSNLDDGVALFLEKYFANSL